METSELNVIAGIFTGPMAIAAVNWLVCIAPTMIGGYWSSVGIVAKAVDVHSALSLGMPIQLPTKGSNTVSVSRIGISHSMVSIHLNPKRR